MIDLSKEVLVPVWPDAAKLFPLQRNGRHPSRATMYRRVNDSENPLEVIKCGGSLYSTAEAIQRWVERETERNGRMQRPACETSAVRDARKEAAKRRLLKHGINTDRQSAVQRR